MSFNTPLISEFTQQVATAARTHFGTDNIRAVWNDSDMGSLAIQMAPCNPREVLNSLNDLHVTLVMTGSNSMDIHFGHSPLFTPTMFNRVVQIVGTDSAAAGLRMDASKSTPVSRQLTLSQFDLQHLREQAELIVAALNSGIKNSGPEAKDPAGIDHII